MSKSLRSRRKPARAGGISGIVRRFRDENMLQTSAALAFTTLVSLVPLVTVIVAVAGKVPYFDLLLGRLEGLIREALLPPGAGGTIAGSIGGFSRKAQQLTLAGIALLGVTAFMLMQTIERTFNHLWQVAPRPFLARLRLYALVMAVWPFVLGAVVGLVSFAVSTSLGLFDEPLWFRRLAIKGSALILLGLSFAGLYHAVPNVRVEWRAALTGGLFATIAFAVMQKVFESFLVSSAMLKSIYGAFAAFPVFLVWLNLSWAVVLVGGLIAAQVNGPARR